MNRSSSKSALLAALALAATAGGFGAGTTTIVDDTLNQSVLNKIAERQERSARQDVDRGTNLSRTGERNAIAKAMFGSYDSYKHSYPNGPGWSQAQVQRMARKRRNKARNRRAHK